uniref:Tetraspanin n=1 Tax=Neogobius melanostomus TaxID=47308 RepID=A0A8C6UUE9_9GOBI
MSLGRVVLTPSDRRSLARVLVLLNWVSVVTGAVLVLVGVYLWAELWRWEVVLSEGVVWAVPAVLVWTGLTACVVNLTGAWLCLDAADVNRFLRWKLAMAPYVGVSLLLTAGVLLVAALCLAAAARLDGALEAGLSVAMRRYKDWDRHPGLKTRLDLLQIHMSCCGNVRYQDWFRVQWVPDRYLDRTDPGVRARLSSNVIGRYLSDSVPFSCCDPASPWPCPQTHLRSKALETHYSSILHHISLIAVGVWAFEVSHMLVVTGVRYLLCETARQNLIIMKSLGKCYQGDDDPNIDRPITGSGGRRTDQSDTEGRSLWGNRKQLNRLNQD